MSGPEVASPVNLNRARKQWARTVKKAQADANAARAGMPKAERLRAGRISEIAARRLDGHKIVEK